MGQLRAYLKAEFQRMGELVAVLPDLLKQSSRLMSDYIYLRVFASSYIFQRGMQEPLGGSLLGKNDFSDFNRKIDNCLREILGGSLLGKNDFLDDQRMINHLRVADELLQPAAKAKLEYLFARKMVREWEQAQPYSSQMTTLFTRELSDILFFYEVANSQKNNDKTMLTCADEHRANIVGYSEECGYKKTFELVEDDERRIPADVFRECVSGFCGLCNECGKPTINRCPQCHYTRYCGKTCQRRGWKSHRRCCPMLKGAVVHPSAEEEAEEEGEEG